MNDWQVTPRPERVSELYFANYRQLPATFRPDVAQRFSFTVENLEHQTTTYRYQVVAAAGSSNERQLGAGVLVVPDSHSQTTSQTVMIPSLGARVMVKVNLEYQGIGFGNVTPTRQSQSIDYWVTAAGSATTGRGAA